MSTSVESSDDKPSLAVIDGFVLDCLLSDSHTFDSEVTEFPVESGATISDNIRPKPLVIVMEAIVSNTPLTFAGNFRGSGSVPSIDCYVKLLAIRRERRLVTISTSLETFDNMALESLGVPRASGRGDELRFTATFKQVQIVVNKRETRVAIPQAQGASAKSVTTTEWRSTTDTWLYPIDQTWFDRDINAWRKYFEVSSDHPGFYLLFKARPELIDKKHYNAFDPKTANDKALIAQLAKSKDPRAANPFLDRDMRLVTAVPPGQIIHGFR